LADISAMFYQVKLYPEDSNFVQFLWWRNGDPHKAVIKYKVCVHAFGLTSSPFIAAYALRQVALDNVAGVSDKTIATALDSFYVDDLLTSVSTEKELVSLVSEFDRLLGSRGFHLTKFSSNSERVLATIPQDRLAPLHQFFEFGNFPTSKALGVAYNAATDDFVLLVNIEEKLMTRPIFRSHWLSTALSVTGYIDSTKGVQRRPFMG